MWTTALGLGSAVCVTSFVQDFVFDTIRVRGYSWQFAAVFFAVVLAHIEDQPHACLERLARADEARAIALEALARTVPYFEAISNIENDVTKTTAAVEAQRADQRTAADKTGYTTGLTDERVFRDPAFKVGLAMRSLGVARTGAARDAVARLVGPRAMNPITGARC